VAVNPPPMMANLNGISVSTDHRARYPHPADGFPSSRSLAPGNQSILTSLVSREAYGLTVPYRCGSGQLKWRFSKKRMDGSEFRPYIVSSKAWMHPLKGSEKPNE
jgi:hypothetical protein